MRTAVVGMRSIPGFEREIMQILATRRQGLLLDAVSAAGIWELASAWELILPLVEAETTDKAILIAAIEALSLIRPSQVVKHLGHLLDSSDDDIREAVEEAIATAEAMEP